MIIEEGTEGGEVQEIEQDIVERVFHIGDKINSLMTSQVGCFFSHSRASKRIYA
jgi:putative hemolysin